MNCCDFGENFKKLRKSRNITQKEFTTHSSTRDGSVCSSYKPFNDTPYLLTKGLRGVHLVSKQVFYFRKSAIAFAIAVFLLWTKDWEGQRTLKGK